MKNNMINEFISIEKEIRSHVTTEVAAFYLNRRPQTLRIWSYSEKGPIRPIRVNGRLAWCVSEIKDILQIQK